MVLDALIMFQATVDLPRLQATFVVEDVSEFVEAALVEFDTAVGDVGLATKGGVDVTRGRIVSVDCQETEGEFPL